MNQVLKITFRFIFLFNYIVCNSQNPYAINFSSKNGLPSDKVYYVLQDKQGFIWFTTNSGVSKYDGTTFTNFSISDGLPDNSIYGLYEDSKERKWLFSSNGKVSFIKDNRVFDEKQFPVFSKITNGNFISIVYEDANGNVWVAFKDGNIYELNEDLTSVLKHPYLNIVVKLFSQNDSVYAFCRAGIFNLTSNKMSKNINGSVMDPNFKVIETERSLNVFTKTTYFEFDRKKFELLKNVELKAEMVVNHSLSKENKFFIVGSKGLILYDFNSKNFPHLFKDQALSCIIEDSEKGIWISSLTNGVYYIPDINFLQLTSKDGLALDHSVKITGTSNNRLLVSHYKNLLSVINNGTISTISVNKSDYGEGYNSGIIAAGEEDVFFATFQGGAIKYSFKNGIIGSADYLIDDIGPVNQDTILIATTDGIHFDKAKFKDLRYLVNSINETRMDSTRYTGIYYDKKNRLLYACSKVKFSFFKNWKLQANDGFKELENKNLIDIAGLSDGTPCVLSNGYGIFLIKEGEIININISNGLLDNNCKAMFIDRKDNIWVITQTGLHKITFKQGAGKIDYNIKYLLSEYPFLVSNLTSVYAYNDTVWVTSSDGVTRFYEHNNKKETFTPNVIVKNITVNGVTFPLNSNEKLELNSNQNDVAFSFNCLTYKFKAALKYFYRLSPKDTNWIETSYNSIVFSDMAPGDYQFEIRAANDNSNLKSKITTFRFSIIPAFYQTTLFKIIVFCLILMIIGIVVFLRLRIIKKKFLVKQKLLTVEKELAEFEQQALQSQMNPHFIFNALNSIQRYILKSKTEEAYNYLGMFSSLIRKILDNSRRKTISLEDELATIDLYLQIESLRFNENFKYNIEIGDLIDTSAYYLPPMLIQPFIENAIWHGLMPKEEGIRQLTINFSIEGKFLICKVEDNGIGRERSVAMSEKNKSSLGLKLIEARIKNINQSSDAMFEFFIFDRKNKNGESEGTRVVLKMPINHEGSIS